MSTPQSDRNLLVGVVALQLSLVSETQLVAGMKAWSFGKDKLLEDIFFEQGAIHENARHMLRELANNSHAQRPRSRESDSGESLTTIMNALQGLSYIEDPELKKSITKLMGADTAGMTQPYEIKTYQGQSSSGRFRFCRPLDQGGLGQVSVAMDTEFEREVVVKEIQPKYLDIPECHQRFKLEAEVTARLEHPGIVPVYSRGTSSQGGPFYAMQYIRGSSMREAISAVHSDKAKLDPHAKLLEIRKLIIRLLAACQAVHFANTKQVIHRDIKPHNIMLGKFGETIVVDWGLARTTKPGVEQTHAGDASYFIPSDGSSSNTRHGRTIGTWEYMSPEQAAGRLQDLGPASDAFSLGATLYCILTGSHPKSENPEYTHRQLDYGNFVKPSKLNRGIPHALEAICLKALATDIRQRYQTAAELMEDLEAWLAEEPVKAYQEPLRDRLRRWIKRHRTAAATLAGVLLTSLLALFVLLVMSEISNRALMQAKDEALANEAVSRQLLLKELQLDQQMLSKNELTFDQIAQYRLTVNEGAFQVYERWHKRDPEDRQLQNEFAFVAKALANLNFSAGLFGPARVYMDVARTAHRATPVNRKTTAEKLEYLQAEIDSSEIDYWLGQLDRALSSTKLAEEALAALSAEDLESNQRQKLSSIVVLQRAKILSEIGQTDNAQEIFKKSEALTQSLLEKNQSDIELRSLHLMARKNQVRALQAMGNSQSAITMAKQVLDEARVLGELPVRDAKQAWISALALLAEICLETKVETENIDQLLDEAESVLSTEKSRGTSANYQALSVRIRTLRGRQYRETASLDRSIQVLEQARVEAQSLTNRLRIPEYLRLSADSELQLAESYLATGDAARAEVCRQGALKMLQDAHTMSPQSKSIDSTLHQLQTTIDSK